MCGKFRKYFELRKSSEVFFPDFGHKIWEKDPETRFQGEFRNSK